ncbi:MAG: MobC family plasmid mobilization relaxosome protein [Ruminococcus sp.]|nr:MobC family plasmid mobilization relaxosome protein [Ruminococcus sp.]
MENNRNRIVKFRVSEKEYAYLCQKMKNAECETMSQLVRRLCLRGGIIKIDMSDLTEMRKLVSAISNNINQIAKRVNIENTIYDEDWKEIKKEVNEIWRQLNFMQSSVHQLEP